jgi:sugar lactone lactonase YvrE
MSSHKRLIGKHHTKGILIIFLAAAVMTLLIGAHAHAVSFDAAMNLNVGENSPNSVTAVDLNGDGTVDLVISNLDTANVSVRLGNGDGTFQPSVNHTVGNFPNSVTAADLNGDGTPDLAVANGFDNTISVLLGNGDGTFRAAVNYSTGSFPHSVRAADLNGDGKMDLVTANADSNDVSAFLGNGDGTFQAAQNIIGGLASCKSLVIADLNGDGNLDLAVANSGAATVAVLLGNGDGSFQPAILVYGVNTPYSVTVADLNGDGKQDLVVANFGSAAVSVHIGNGDGTFQPASYIFIGSFTVRPNFAAIADLNGDGKPDIAFTSYGSSNVFVMLGNGDGTFQSAVNFPVPVSAGSVTIADLNTDGILDLAVTNSNFTSVLLGNGDGTFQTAVNYGANPSFVTAADLNEYAQLDLVVANYGSSSVSVHMGLNNGTYDPAVKYYQVGKGPASVAVSDLNGDGHSDLAVANSGSDNVSVLLGSGYGEFQAAVNYLVGKAPTSVMTSDLNSDGKSDLAVANKGSNDVSVLLGNGNGTFQAAVNYDAGTGPSSVTMADLNGDGKRDLIVANSGSDNVSVLLGNGNGTFQAAANYAAGTSPSSVTAADLNGDGKPDLVVANRGSNNVSVLLGNGDGTFQAATNFGAGTGPSSVTAVDLDGDGKSDLAVSNSGSGNVSVLRGIGDGTFQVATNFAAGTGPSSVTAADLNGDGKQDLAIANFGDGSVSVLHNAMLRIVPSASQGGRVTCSPTMVDPQGSSSCSITSDPGYVIGNVLVNGWLSVGAVGSYDFINVVSDQSISASFIRQYQLSVAISGSGSVTSSPAGIDCGPTCSASFSEGTSVVLTASPGTGQMFTGWSGTCSGTLDGNTYAAGPIIASCTVTATFILISSPPDPFTFIDQVNIPLNMLVTSNTITVTGITIAVPIMITSGQYEINGNGLWTSQTGTVTNYSTVRVRRTSSSTSSTTTNAILTIGGVSDTFSVTTRPPDTTPDPFTFADRSNVTVDTLIISNSITIAGLEAAAPVTITDGEYELNGSGTWSSAGGTVVNGNTVRVRQMSSSTYGTRTDTTLTIGGVFDAFSVTTLPPDTTPDPFAFSEQRNAAINAVITSNSIKVSGINMPALVAVSGGEYEVNNSGIWMSTGGTVIDGNTVRVRQMSASAYGIRTDTSLTIGGASATFSIVTSPDISVALTTNLANPQPVSTFVAFTATSSGGTGHYEYKFRLRTAGVWTTVQDYSTAATWNWDTTGYQSGEYMVAVQVRNAGDTITYASEGSITYDLYNIGDIYTVAGGVGDGGLAVSAKITSPTKAAKDARGNIYIADSFGNRIRKVDASTGVISTIAGSGLGGYSGDNVPATSASLYYPAGVALDRAGNIYIAETTSNRVRKVDAVTGLITTVVGNGTSGYSGDNGPAASAQLSGPGGVAVDGSDNIYIADTSNNRIRKIDALTGVIMTVAGNGTGGFSGDNGLATVASLWAPGDVASDGSGNIYIADSNNTRIRRVDAATGVIATVAGNGTFGYSGDNGAAVSASLYGPKGISVDSGGNIYIADTTNYRIRKVAAVSGLITTIAGTGTSGYTGDNGPAVSAKLGFPQGVVADGEGSILIVDTGNNRIRSVDSATGLISTIAGVSVGPYGGAYAGDGGPAALALLSEPDRVAVDTAGNIIIADTANHRIRQVDAFTGAIATVAGNGISGLSGDNGPATAASLSASRGVAVDGSGNIFIADTNNDRIRRVDAITGVITTVAGTGSGGYAGDNGQATSAWISVPFEVALDSVGNVYIADTYNSRIRRVDAITGVITTVAGSYGYGYAGDNGSATAASLAMPHGVAIDSSGNIFIVDTNNKRIRKVDALTSVITTVAGNGDSGYSGDNGAASSAALYEPWGAGVANGGDIYIADTSNHRIRKVDAATGVITTIAGNGTNGSSGDCGPAIAASISNPTGVAFDSTGSLYIASDNRIRKIVAYDVMPNVFSFIAQTGIAVGTQVMSNAITVTGINRPVAISITGGEYELNGSGMWTAATGTVNNGYSVRVRQTASLNYETTTNAVLVIGSVFGALGVTTASLDTAPDPLGFTDQTNVALNTLITSNSITVTGIGSAALVMISGGEYEINSSGVWSSTSGTVVNGDTVRVREMSAPDYATRIDTILHVGDISGTFSVTTIAADSTPDKFTFADQTNVPVDTLLTSNTITVTGINTPAAISIIGGAYSISGGTYTSATGTVANGQSVSVRQTSASSYSTKTDTILTIGDISDTFSVTTVPVPDITPDQFTFADQTNVPVDTLLTSNSITVIGINVPTAISITGGMYSLSGAPYTSATGMIVNGQSVNVRQTSASSYSTRTDTTLTIGGVSDTFSITTLVYDTAPNPFAFIDQANAILSTLVTSISITVAGITMPAPVTIMGGEYEINGNGIWSTASGTVVNGNTVRVRQTSSSSYGTRTDTTLTIGGVSDIFSVTTLVPDTSPNPFAFIDQTNVTVSTLATSNSITVAGINMPASVTISGGEYEINGNGIWSSASGTVVNGNTVRVRQTSSSGYATRTDTILTIGGIFDTFSITTLVLDATPDAFAFAARLNTAVNTLITSNSILVTGITAPASVTVTGGEYEINNSGIWLSSGGTVMNGNTVRVRRTSSPNSRTKTDTVLTVGGVSGTFSVTTLSDFDATLTTNLVSPQPASTLVTFMSNGIGGSGNFEYKFRLRVSGVWTTVQDYSISNTWTWNTTGYQSGEYLVRVYVRLAGDSIEYPVERSIAYRLYNIGDVYTVAGGIGDGGQAVSAKLMNPYGIAEDALGNIYIADSDLNRIRKVDAATGVISTVAGNGSTGYSGDNGPATSASIYYPTGVAVDAAGHIYIADKFNNRIRRVDAATAVITTVAGGGSNYPGDNGPATSARLNNPSGVALDNSGNMYFADMNYNRIRKVNAITGVITTVAGNGTFGYSGDNGLATTAILNYPLSIAIDNLGNMYIADTNNNRIRKVDAITGVITTVAGNGTAGYSGDNGAATSANLYHPSGISVDSMGDLYITDNNTRIRKIAAATGVITTIAGTVMSAYTGDNGPAVSASLNYPNGVFADAARNILIADTGNYRIRKIDAATGIITTVAGLGYGGAYAGDNGPALSALLSYPGVVAYDRSGNMFIADTYNQRIRKIDAATGLLTTVAGNGTAGYSGDNGAAASATLRYPAGIACDAVGNVYVADTENSRIRKIDAETGIISTIAGDGMSGYSGDNGPATSATLNYPLGIAFDGAGNLYMADQWSSRIRKVDISTGIITTVAGSAASGYSGDNAAATAASLNVPKGVALDAAGNIYIADSSNHRIRKVDAVTGVITTVAGTGSLGYSGDNGPAIAAALFYPKGVAVDAAGSFVYIADSNNYRIRKVETATGVISTVAGNGSRGFSGDYGPATSARLDLLSTYANGIVLDSAGNIYFPDSSNDRIRKIVAFDATPDPFAYFAQTGIALNTQVVSNAITVTGMNSSAAISVIGGEYEVNRSGIWTSATGTVNNGHSVRVRVVSSSDYTSITSATLTIGGVSAPFHVTTWAYGPVSSVTLAANPASPQAENTPVMFTATATGSGANKEYQFSVQAPGGTMTVIQQYGPSNTFSYTPAITGTYNIRVFARNAGSTATYEAARWLTYNIVAASPITAVTLTVTPVSPQVVNTKVTFTATATGGVNKEYQFAVQAPGGTMTVIQNYGPSNTFSYTPATAGTYNVRVFARNAGNPATYEAARWLTYVANPAITAVGLSASPAGSQMVNMLVTFTATPTGGGANKEYQFAVQTPGGTMTVVRPYATSNTFTYTPTITGTHNIRVFARNVGNAATYEAARWLLYDVVAGSPITAVSLSAGPSSPQAVNTPVLFTATPTGGGVNIEYQFAVQAPGGVMTVIQSYGSSNTFSCTPTIPGTYNVRVFARNAGNPAAYEGARWHAYTVTP